MQIAGRIDHAAYARGVCHEPTGRARAAIKLLATGSEFVLLSFFEHRGLFLKLPELPTIVILPPRVRRFFLQQFEDQRPGLLPIFGDIRLFRSHRIYPSNLPSPPKVLLGSTGLLRRECLGRDPI